jgi:hypothetical protein
MAMFNSYQKVSIIYNMLEEKELFGIMWKPCARPIMNTLQELIVWLSYCNSPPFMERTLKKIHESTQPVVLPGTYIILASRSIPKYGETNVDHHPIYRMKSNTYLKPPTDRIGLKGKANIKA